MIKDPKAGFYFTLRTGYSCNNKCIHCFVENKKNIDDLSEETLKHTIDTIPKGSTVCFTGGEPTVRTDLLSLLKYSKKKGFLNSIQTNGFKLGNIEYFKTLEPYIDSIVIPIHSNDMNIFDRITQVPGSGFQTIKAFEHIIDSKNIIVTTQTVINQLNYKTLKNTFDFIQNKNPNSMTLTFPHPYGSAYSTDVVPTYSDAAPFIKSVLKEYASLMHTHYIPRCYLYPYHNIVVNVDEHDDGNMVKLGIDFTGRKWEKVDYGAYIQNSKIKDVSCVSCVFNHECNGIWSEYKELYGFLDIMPIEIDNIKFDAPQVYKHEKNKVMIYKLSDGTVVNNILFNEDCQIITDNKGKILEKQYLIKNKMELFTPEEIEIINLNGVDINTSLVSVFNNKISNYYLKFAPEKYILSELDTELKSISKNIILKINTKDDDFIIWYELGWVRDTKTLRNFFQRNNMINCYNNLKNIVQDESNYNSLSIALETDSNCLACLS